MAFERDACNAKAGCLQAVLNRYHLACNHITKRLNDEEIRLEGDRAAAANKGRGEMTFSVWSRSLVEGLCGKTYLPRAGFF